MESMSYSFPVLSELIEKHKSSHLSNVCLLCIQPVLIDSFYLIKGLREIGFEILGVISLDYSTNDYVSQKLADIKIKHIEATAETIYSLAEEQLKHAIEYCKTNNKKLLLLENGGYLTPIFHQKFQSEADVCIGTVEETKRGIWDVEETIITNPLLFPIIQVADTFIKGIESALIGEPVTMVLEKILRDTGLGIQGKKIGVIGYGWIGSGIADALRARKAIVKVYDKDPRKMVKAYFDGCVTDSREQLIINSEIIIGATGVNSIVGDDYEKMIDGVFIASASSRRIEINTDILTRLYNNTTKEHPWFENYVSKKGKTIRLIGRGTPINFLIDSMPNELMEIMMCDMLLALLDLVNKKISIKVQPAFIENERTIALSWLKTKNIIL